MKKIILIILCCFSFNMVNAQNLNFPNWLLQGNISIEKHDKRSFGYPDLSAAFASQSTWGTYHYRLTANKKIFSHWKITTYMGLGLNYERATLIRPFNHSYFNKEDASFRILRNLNRYKKLQFQTPIQFCYTLTGNLLLKLEAFASWRLYRNLNYKKVTGDYFPYTESKLEFESIELLSGLSLKLNHIMFGVDVRVLNFQKVDRIISSHYYKPNEKMELQNPLLFQFLVGYFFGGGAQKPTLR